MLQPSELSNLRRVIAVANEKGGIGKTSLNANVAALLGEAGYKVLVVETDPQGNLSQDLGYASKNVSDDGEGMAHALLTGDASRLHVVAARDNLDVLPGGPALYVAQRQLDRQVDDGDGALDPLQHLGRALAQVAPKYDVVLIDTPPTNPTLQMVALAASRWLIIPVRPDASSRGGLRAMANRFLQVQEINPALDLLGIVLFGVGINEHRVRREALADINADFDGAAPLFQTAIRYVGAAAFDARRRGQTANELEQVIATATPWWEHLRNPGSRGSGPERLADSASSLAGDYQALTDEITARLAEAETTAGLEGEQA